MSPLRKLVPCCAATAFSCERGISKDSNGDVVLMHMSSAYVAQSSSTPRPTIPRFERSDTRRPVSS
jgi:hypothetical protein